MSRRLSVQPTQPSALQTVTLDGVPFRVRLTYRYRLAAWYLDLWTIDMTPLALGRRLSAGWMPLAGYDLPDGPDGFFYVRGSDGYDRLDLGGTVQLIYFSRAELAAAKALRPTLDPVVIDL